MAFFSPPPKCHYLAEKEMGSGGYKTAMKFKVFSFFFLIQGVNSAAGSVACSAETLVTAQGRSLDLIKPHGI